MSSGLVIIINSLLVSKLAKSVIKISVKIEILFYKDLTKYY